MNIIDEFVSLANLAYGIQESGAEWKTIYNLIFSDLISGAIRRTGIDFEWCDPDMDYEDDVRAYVYAVKEKAIELQRIAETINA